MDSMLILYQYENDKFSQILHTGLLMYLIKQSEGIYDLLFYNIAKAPHSSDFNESSDLQLTPHFMPY